MCIRDHPTEVRADLQRYYGLYLDKLGVEFSAVQAAACLVCLPAGSALMARLNPMMGFSPAEHYLHLLLSAIAGQEIPYPWEKDVKTDKAIELDESSGGLPEFEGLPHDEFMAWYNQEWREVESGRKDIR